MTFVWYVGGASEDYHPGPPALARQVGPVAAPVGVPEIHEAAAHAWETGPASEAYRHVSEAPTERMPAVLAEQIMSSPVIVIYPGDSVTAAQEIITRRRFRHLPVVSPDMRIVGILSDRDLLLAAAADSPPETVNRIMSRRVLTAGPETEIREIARVMVRERIGALPIVDARSVLVGIVTSTDVLRCVVHRAPLDLWI